MGKHIEVPPGKIAVVQNTIDSPGWLIFIADTNEEELVKTSFHLQGNRN